MHRERGSNGGRREYGNLTLLTSRPTALGFNNRDDCRRITQYYITTNTTTTTTTTTSEITILHYPSIHPSIPWAIVLAKGTSQSTSQPTRHSTLLGSRTD